MSIRWSNLKMLLLAAAVCFGLMVSPAWAAEKWAAVSLDANTLGLGYIIEPTLIDITEQPKASVVLTNFLRDNITTPDGSEPWKMTGTIDSGFYLSQIYCPLQQNAEVPEYIVAALGDDVDYSARDGVWLGEFNYSTMSGWMYSVNSKFPNVGAASYTLSDGDVMRWQFTVYGYGADINADNSEWGQPSIVNSGSKDDLTWQVAYLNGRFAKSVLEQNEAYSQAMTVLQDPTASEDAVSGAFAKLLPAVKLYNDTDLDNEALAAINRLTARHFLNGTGNGNFEPDAPMTMPMFLTVMYRMSGSPEADGAAYPGLEEWARPAVAWAVANGLLDEAAAQNLTNSSVVSPAAAVELANKLVVLADGPDGTISYTADRHLSRAQAAELLADIYVALQKIKLLA